MVRKINLDVYDFILISIIILTVVSQIILIAPMKQIPSPLYGGDFYAQLGAVDHVRYGGNPFVSSNTLDDLPGVYPPVYTWLAAEFANVFDIESTSKAVLYLSLILAVAAIFVSYILFYKIFKDKGFAVIGMLLFLSVRDFPILKAGSFEEKVITPLFLLALYMLYRNPNLFNSILTGVVFGIGTLTHGYVIIVYSSLLLMLIFYSSVIKNVNINKKTFDKGSLKKELPRLKFLLLAFGIGFIISLLYFYKPMFVLGGNAPNYAILWGTANLFDVSVLFSTLTAYFGLIFFNFSNVFSVILSIISIAGVIFLIFTKNKGYDTKFIALVVISAFLLMIHPIFTIPILKTHFVTGYMYVKIGLIAIACLQLYSIKSMTKVASSYLKKDITKIVFIIFLVLLLVSEIIDYNDNLNNNIWLKTGRSDLPPMIKSASDWLLKNTDVNDVILSANENAFAINALTGRKTLTNRRTHMSIYLDTDKNFMDGAVILYGNDTQKRNETIHKTGVKYLYWDVNWLNLEYTLQDGKIANVFDPITLIYSKERENELKRYNISYIKLYTWLDPAAKDPAIMRMDIMYVLPYSWDINRIWNPDLNKYLKEVWSLNYGPNMTIARVFEVVQ